MLGKRRKRAKERLLGNLFRGWDEEQYLQREELDGGQLGHSGLETKGRRTSKRKGLVSTAKGCQEVGDSEGRGQSC